MGLNYHSLSMRVYYQDTDAGGVVYHANYLKFMERGRTEWWEDRGKLLSALEKEKIYFVVRKLDIEFKKPARLNQIIYVITHPTDIRHASIIFNQEIRLEGADGPLLCRATIQLACVNEHLRPIRLPQKCGF